MITLPLVDILNFFFAELLVLSFGILESGYTKNALNLQPIYRVIKAGLPLSFAYRQISGAILPFQYLSCHP